MVDTERLDGTYLSTQALHGGLGQQKGHHGSSTGRPHHVLGSPQSLSVEHLRGGVGIYLVFSTPGEKGEQPRHPSDTSMWQV